MKQVEVCTCLLFSGIILIQLDGLFGVVTQVLDETNNTYITNKGVTCYLCPPGFKWTADCTKSNHTASCTPCEDNTFHSQYNRSPRCAKCSTDCSHLHRGKFVAGNAYITENCTRTNDIKCQCVSGTYKKSYGIRNKCIEYKICSIGEGVAQKGESKACTSENVLEFYGSTFNQSHSQANYP